MEQERVAVLETKVDALEKQNEEIISKLDAIATQVTKTKGFVGGIIFLVSCMFTLAINVGDMLKALKGFFH